jgi:hypothetical protein
MTGNSDWLYDPPSPFAPRAEWEDHLKWLREVTGGQPHSQLDEAIAKAEEMLNGTVLYRSSADGWVIDDPSENAPRQVWETFLENLRDQATPQSHPEILAAIARAEAILSRPASTPPEGSHLKTPSEKSERFDSCPQFPPLGHFA